MRINLEVGYFSSYIAQELQMQYTKVNNLIMDRKRKSEALLKEEHKAFIKYLNSFPTKIDAQFAIGVSRQVLDMVALRGSGSTETINTIRKKLEEISVGQD